MAEIIGAGIVSLQTDLQECYRLLDGLEHNNKTVRKYIMRAASTGGRSYVKRQYKSVLHKRTGQLYKSLTSYVDRQGYKIVFTNSADSGKKTSKDGRTARYGFMLASGYTIQPKDKGKTLTFQINGKWVRKYSVTVRPKDFIEAPVDRYFESHDCEERMEKAAQKQVDYWEKRAAQGGNR